MKRLLGILALAGFVMSLVVHGATLKGIDVSERSPAVWLLHVGIFVVFGPFVFSTRRQLGARPRIGQLLEVLPGWVSFVGAALFAYAFINFALFMSRAEGGAPSFQGGRYLLMNHGRLIREITEPEYTALRANELRGFSGHWLIFYFIPFAYFMFGKMPNDFPHPSPADGRG